MRQKLKIKKKENGGKEVIVTGGLLITSHANKTTACAVKEVSTAFDPCCTMVEYVLRKDALPGGTERRVMRNATLVCHRA